MDPRHHLAIKNQTPAGSSRILDIPCKVCGDFSSGKHYNIFACDGCAGFFKRSIRRNRQYVCKAKDEGTCIIDKTHRNQCRACRLQKCQEAGMNRDAVQHERGPRNSTLRRQQQQQHQQQTQYYNDHRLVITSPTRHLLGVVDFDATVKIESTIPVTNVPPATVPPPPPPLVPPILPIPRVPQLPLFPYIPPLLNPSAICETAAQLLLMNVQWVRNMPTFTTLPIQDQMCLLEESWLDLFILGAAQFISFMDLRLLVQTTDIYQEQQQQQQQEQDGNNNKERLENFLKNVQNFQDTLLRIQQFQLDSHEYSCLRVIVLFKIQFGGGDEQNGERNLVEKAKISSIQEDAYLTLNRYITATYPKQPLRFGKILLLINSVFKHVPAGTVEELFFKKVIKDTPLVAIISNMYRNQIQIGS